MNTDKLCEVLRTITKEIGLKDSSLQAHGLLGGPDSYGALWNSDVFEMHPYCWCELEDCPWCAGIGEDQDPILKEKIIAHGGIPTELPVYGAPNFWHKSSGLRVWWYKWIGRDTQVHGTCNRNDLLQQCLDDIKGV